MNLPLILCLWLGASQLAFGQEIFTPEQQEQIAANVSQFIDDLNLSEADKPAFVEIIGDFFIGLVAVGATNHPMKTNKKIIKALIKGRDNRMKSLLSTDQYKVYKIRVKERQANIKELMR